MLDWVSGGGPGRAESTMLGPSKHPPTASHRCVRADTPDVGPARRIPAECCGGPPQPDVLIHHTRRVSPCTASSGRAWEAFDAPAQLQRWETSVNALLYHGQLRAPAVIPDSV